MPGGVHSRGWRMLMQAATLVIGLSGLSLGMSASADVYIGDTSKDHTDLVITGDITQRDLAFFRSRAKDLESKPITRVWLDSRGGDVFSAMEIGRIIRSLEGWTQVAENAHCYSSCALIYISGIYRSSLGEIGLHRPYFASTPLSREQIEKQVPLMRSAVKKYVEEMGITDSFFEQMFNTEPSNMEIFSLDEIEKMVPVSDPVYDEIQTAFMARRYGLTTSEYRKRDLLTRSCWDGTRTPARVVDCQEPLLWGLSLEDYRSREAMVKAKCGEFSDSEKQIISATPRKNREALPFFVKFLACQLDTMRGK
ncbi:hypothetical protein JQ615_18325 [Bradyrhizobium jicamae]|uniref:Peptidase S14 n=1 Tax=Bradyrhizobium jicamae TaxID=280332 RepID=A0ABS5FKM9_9BRAD|nr:hypothetical protein [Bradyrhizobium jicamae]MBR0797347.1 hypothetical protein [Bradyrhizobium jicamae]